MSFYFLQRTVGYRPISLGTLFALLAFGVFPPQASAQGPTTGSISGTITDPSGAVVPDAKITVTSPALINPQSILSSGEGTYRFPSLPPGTYAVNVEAAGFALTGRADIPLSAGFSATIDIPMTLAGQTQSVSVTAEVALLDTENTKVTNTFTTAVMNNLPTSRDMWSLAGVAPGMSLNRFDVGGSTMGTQTTYTSYGVSGQQRVQMDGVNMTEGNGATSAYTDYSAFEEMQIGTSGNDASMPSPGAQVNFVVKSGGNNFHGDFYQDYERSNWQGTNISREQLLKGAGTGTRITGYRDTNGDFGGPIKKDKLWFFTSVRRQYIGTTITGYPVNAPGSLPFNTTLDNLTYKVSYQVNATNKISQMLNFERKQQPFRDAANTRYGDAVFKQNFPQWIGNLEWSSTLSPSAFLNVRLGSWGYNWTDRAYANSVTGVIEPRRVENQTGNISGGYAPRGQFRRRFQVEPTFSYTMANHFMTFGYLYEREVFYLEQLPFKDAQQLTFASAAGQPDFTTPSQITIYSTPSNRTDFMMHNGAYAQDKMKIGRRITINFGVRWDAYKQYYPDAKIRDDAPYRAFFFQGQALPNGYALPASFPSLAIPGNSNVLSYTHSFAPRVGLAWDLFGNGRTSVKISYGRYYSNPSTVISAAVNPTRELSATFGWNDLNGDKKFTNNEFGAFRSTSAGGALATIDPNIKHPYMDDISAFLEHNITHGLIFRGGFVYRKQARDWANIEIARNTGLYTGTVNFTDPGPDGTTPTVIQVADIPAGVTIPASQTQYQSPDWNKTYNRSFEATVTKRMSSNWMISASFLGTWGGNIRTPAAVHPNILKYNNFASYDSNFKVYGTYNAKWGIVISPMFRYQLGDQIERSLAVTGLRAGNITIPVSSPSAYRQDNVAIFDTRIEKQLRFKDKYKVGLFFDGFNLNNSNANQTQDSVTGTRTTVVDGKTVTYQRFLSPTAVISPRIYRIGAKFSF